MKYNKINVFFDTNKLECRFNGKKLFLDDIKFNADFNEILEFASDNDNVSFYIPLIVWREILNHLIEDFNESKQSMDDTIQSYKKGFGSLIDISVTFDTEIYEEYIQQKADCFLENNKENVTVVSHSNHEEKFKRIIDNAISKKSPFVTAKGKNKIYSDAGFKDMLILETMVDNCKYDEIGVLYTNDRDFKEAFEEYENDKYYIAHTINELKNLISDQSAKLIEKNIKKDFIKNEYLQETIYNELKMEKKDITSFDVYEVFQSEDIYIIIARIVSSEKTVGVSIEYDYIANEIVNIQKGECDNNG